MIGEMPDLLASRALVTGAQPATEEVPSGRCLPYKGAGELPVPGLRPTSAGNFQTHLLA